MLQKREPLIIIHYCIRASPRIIPISLLFSYYLAKSRLRLYNINMNRRIITNIAKLNKYVHTGNVYSFATSVSNFDIKKNEVVKCLHLLFVWKKNIRYLKENVTMAVVCRMWWKLDTEKTSIRLVWSSWRYAGYNFNNQI